MKSTKYLEILTIATALTLYASNSFAEPKQGKGSNTNRNGQARSHMSSKGAENSNAQWSADPERGWVRAEERHGIQKQGHGTNKSKQNHGKQKGHNMKGGAVKGAKN